MLSNEEMLGLNQYGALGMGGAGSPALSANPLFHKQAVILLREELDYFAIPPKRPAQADPDAPHYPATDADGFANEPLIRLKKEAGQNLLGRKSIFTALQRNVNREKNIAEQHLIDMLCMSYVSNVLLTWPGVSLTAHCFPPFQRV